MFGMAASQPFQTEVSLKVSCLHLVLLGSNDPTHACRMKFVLNLKFVLKKLELATYFLYIIVIWFVIIIEFSKREESLYIQMAAKLKLITIAISIS